MRHRRNKKPCLFPSRTYLAHIGARRNDSWNVRLPALFPNFNLLSHGKFPPHRNFLKKLLWPEKKLHFFNFSSCILRRLELYCY